VTIRSRLTLWYAAIMFISLLLMAALMYHEFAPEPGPDLAEDQGEVAVLFHILFWCGVPAGLLALIGGWWLMKQSLAPLARLTRAAGQITAQNLAARLSRTHSQDELDQLTGVFNSMLARLEDAFKRIQEFTLHASHELKTPLTVLRGETETALRESTLSAAERQRAASQLEELNRLARIVDGLTLLTKADAQQVPLNFERVSLNELVADNFADLQILAEPQAIQVELSMDGDLPVLGDRHRLRQLLLNLAENAVKYNHPGGRVSLHLARKDQFAEFTMTNTGPGIPAAIVPRVFDRFFRGDQAHGTTVEGCGLGLSIAQWIVSAHGGSIHITSDVAQPTVVCVRLPLNQGTFAGPGEPPHPSPLPQ